jgi:hypothetical protein
MRGERAGMRSVWRTPDADGPAATLALDGAWRSLVARGLWVAEDPGSNPGAPTVTLDRICGLVR